MFITFPGKTTILYQLAVNNLVSTIPTLGFNVETISYRDDKVTIWDFGGSPTVRKVWRDYYFQAQGITSFIIIDHHYMLPPEFHVCINFNVSYIKCI